MARSRKEAQKGIQASSAWLYTLRVQKRPSRNQRGILEVVLPTRLGGTGVHRTLNLVGRGDRGEAHRQELISGFWRIPKSGRHRGPSFQQCVRNTCSSLLGLLAKIKCRNTC